MLASSRGELTAISAAEIVLSANTKAHVTLIGPTEPAGLMENDQFREMAAKHADAALARQLRRDPGDGRLTLLRDSGGAPIAKDLAAWEASRSASERGSWVEESEIPAEKRSSRVYDANDRQAHSHGTAYVAAVGRAKAYPPVVASLIDQARRTGGKYFVKALFEDRQYIGYRVSFEEGAGHASAEIEVTGAATRFLPIEDAIAHAKAEDVNDLNRVKVVDNWEAPPESGNFAGGFAATATQVSRYATARRNPNRNGTR